VHKSQPHGHNLAFLIRARSPGHALARTSSHGMPSNDPPERMGARTTETKRQGRARKTSYTNVHKANLGSQLSIFDTGSFTRARPRPNDLNPNEFTRAPSNDPLERPKRTDKGEPGKRAARTCTKPTSGHNLAIFDTGSFARARPRPNDRNEATRESRANELHERAQSQPRVTT
jgi:hypothetical protein